MPWTWNQAVSPLTTDANVNAIINPNGITYNYELPFQNYINYSFDSSQASGAATSAVALTSLQQQCVRNALSYVHSVTGINFNEIPAGSSQPQELVFVYADSTGTNANKQNLLEGDFTSYSMVSTDASGNLKTFNIKNTIAFSTKYDYMSNLQSGSVGYQAMLQGIGQALGLTVPATGNLPAGLDTNNQTLMSSNSDGNSYSSYQPLDIKALNWLYGGDGLLGKYGLTLNSNGVPVANGGPPGGIIVGSLPNSQSQVVVQTT